MAKRQRREATIKSTRQVGDGESQWLRCGGCKELLYRKHFLENLKVCTRCGFHYRISARERMALLFDPDSTTETATTLHSVDPLGFAGAKPYPDSLTQAEAKTGLREACITGTAIVEGMRVAFFILDFDFIGGSMGSVVGEKVARVFDGARDETLPVIGVSASGGARMQEGMLSLYQMAKTSAAVERYREAVAMPYISILTNPTTGGVTASFATLGDIILAEPGALIGFTGPRVIEQTMKVRLPKGFQRAEFLLEHGMLDAVVPRAELRETVASCLRHLGGGS